MDKQNILDIFPLSQPQHALLYYSLNPDRSDPGLIQVRFRIQGNLNEEVFVRAWNDVIGRHDAMRLTVQMPEGHKPMLVLAKSASIGTHFEDLRGWAAPDQSAHLSGFAGQDAQQRLNLAKPAVMRLAVFRTADDRREVIWTCHHLFLDGWSSTVVLRDAMQIYQSLQMKTLPDLPDLTTYRNYVGWLQKQPKADAEQFWSSYLADAQGCSGGLSKLSLGVAAAPGARPVHGSIEVPIGLWPELEKAASKLQVTPSALIATGWAIVLGETATSRDVIFGTTISGRSFDLSGRDAMVGCFSSVIPKRCRMDPSQPVQDVVRAMHADTFAVQPHEHLALDEIQRCSGESGNGALFDSLLVFENLPWKDIKVAVDGGLSVSEYRSDVTTAFPLTLIVVPGHDLKLKFVADAGLDISEVSRTLEKLPGILLRLCENPTRSIEEFLPDNMLADSVNETVGTSRTFSGDVSHLARTPMEFEIAKIWQSVLGLGEIDVDRDFVSLGGRSFAAVRMLTQIEKRFGKRIPLTEFVRAPTIANLAKLLTGETEPDQSWKSLVPIQPGGGKPPLTFLHVGGGHVIFLQPLANRLGPDQPVFGLQPPGLEGETPPLTSFEDLAALYLKELISVQPDGPYNLVGHCGGARLALELAHQIQERGREIAKLIVIDTFAPARNQGESIPATPRTRMSLHFEKLRRGRIDLVAMTFARVLTRPLLRMYVDKFGTPDMKKRAILRHVEKVCTVADGAYVGKPFNGKITLLRCADMLHVDVDWSPFADTVETLQLPARHTEMFFEPDVGTLAAAIAEIIAQPADQEICARSWNSVLESSSESYEPSATISPRSMT